MEKNQIKEKLIYLKSLLEKLDSRLKKYDVEEEDFEKETLYAAMSKFAEEIVETAIKINNILLEEKKDFANTYYESFSKLIAHYSLDKQLFETLAKTTGFRNRISHEYDKLDERITIKSFNLLLENYKKYIETIKNLL